MLCLSLQQLWALSFPPSLPGKAQHGFPGLPAAAARLGPRGLSRRMHQSWDLSDGLPVLPQRKQHSTYGLGWEMERGYFTPLGRDG